MTARNKFSMLELLIVVIIGYSIMPIVSRIFSDYFTTYAYLTVVIFTILAIFVLYGRNFLDNVVVIIIPLLMLEFLIYVITKPSPILWVYRVVTEVLPIIVGVFIVKKESFKNTKIFVFCLFLFLGITAVTTIIGLQIYPDAARYLATVSDAEEEKNVLYNYLNIGGYGFVYTVALLYPIIIYGFKRKKINVVFLIIYIILDFIIVVNSGYTIALLLFIVTTVFIFFRKDITIKEIITIFVIAILTLILLFPLVASGLEALAKVINNKDIAERLRDLAGGKEGLEASEDSRLALYMMSLNSFISHPIFGGMFNNVEVGGHSFILDTIAQYGIFGLAALIFIYREIYIKFFLPYKKQTGYGFVFWTFLQTIILSTVNTGMWIEILALFVPMFFLYINSNGNQYENSLYNKRLKQI